MDNIDFEEIWTTDDICNYLKINKKKVYELYNIPTFPVMKIGRNYRTPKAMLFKWLKKYYKLV